MTLFTILQSQNKMQALNLIGTFDLDPNRVVDIILTVFRKNPSDNSFLQVLKAMDSSVLAHILGFKFQNTTEKCQSLCEVTAKCIKHELLELKSLWGYLKPDDLHKAFLEHEALAQSIKRSLDIVVINSDASAKDRDMQKLFQKDNNNQKLGLLTELIKLNY